MIDQKRKQCHLRFKVICGPKASNCGKYLILLVTFVYQKRMVTSTYVNKNRFTKANLFREIIADT